MMDMEGMMGDILISALASAKDKEVDDLNEAEFLAVAIAAGAALETTYVGIKLKNPVALSKIDGKFHLFERV